MTPKSLLGQDIDSYKEFRTASGRKSASYVKNIRFFDRYCTTNYPEATSLSQEMVDTWCARRPTETPNSCLSRIHPVISLIKYMRLHDRTDVELPRIPRASRRTYIPHMFTKEELKKFFHACDNPKPRKGLQAALQKLTLPVFFRLLYSSGIRTTEAILLKRADVRLPDGVISVKEGKGYGEHYIVMHDTMLDLMRRYDEHISVLMPDRQWFFPACGDRPHTPAWVLYHFRVLWQSCNDTVATPYELRHNYAVENINSWHGVGFGLHDRLLALSKSMGHRDVRSTMGYYSLTPAVADSMAETDNIDKTLIPEL